jgi:hypothetical protein
MVVGAVTNLRNIALHRSGPAWEEHSAAYSYAANTVNVWLNSAAYQGIPRLLLAGAAAILLASAGYSLYALRRLALLDQMPGPFQERPR